MRFWSLDELELEDPLNGEIWSQSPGVQDLVQPYRERWDTGEFGAQQAMRPPFRLPWVPDLVGRRWRQPTAVLVFGSAYGPFIAGSHRNHEMRPDEYLKSSSNEFTRAFMASVIRSRPYYEKIAQLLHNVVSSCGDIMLSDLCRIAFVRSSVPRDVGGDKVVTCAPELFTRYIEHPKSNEWLWHRIVGSAASTVVALGTVAEHGLLRLFVRNLINARIVDSADPTIQFVPRPHDLCWAAKYAHTARKLRHREAARVPPYWDVLGKTDDGIGRRWRVIVVPHPTGARGKTSDYPLRALKHAYVSD